MRRAAAAVVLFAMAFAGVAAVPGAAVALDVGPWRINPATGHYYQQVAAGLTWTQAESYAVSVGGHLVAINDQAEQAWLESTFTTPQLWIGLNDQAEEGTWVWASGEPTTYTNWVPGQPDNCLACSEGEGEDAAVMNWPDGPRTGWNDLAVFDTWSGAIVEVTSLPKGPGGAKLPKCQVSNSTTHIGYSTLQAAHDAAAPGSTLKVKGTCFGTTTISKDLTILGQANPSYGSPTLDGAKGGAVLTIAAGATALIADLTVTNGTGFKLPSGPLIGERRGGGIYVAGSLTLTGVRVVFNTTVGEPVYNYGGGIHIAYGGSLSMTGSTVMGNTVSNDGAGIHNEGTLSIANSAVSGNATPNGWGGGITNGQDHRNGHPAGVTTLTNVAVTGNRAGIGGGFFNYAGSSILTDVTVTGNAASQYGGGIANWASIEFHGTNVLSPNTPDDCYGC